MSLPYATFTLGVADGVVVEAAPIAAWAVGKDARWVWDYYVRKGGDVRWLAV